ncbi:unnamed protein product, partial [Musa textilis]
NRDDLGSRRRSCPVLGHGKKLFTLTRSYDTCKPTFFHISFYFQNNIEVTPCIHEFQQLKKK